MEELKACPFCKSNDVTDDPYVYVRCNKCGATGPKMNGGNNNQHADYVDRKNAREAWNRRFI